MGGGEEQKGVQRLILVTSFVKNAEANEKMWQEVFPSPPTPCSPEIRRKLDQVGRLYRPNLWGEGEPVYFL